MLKGYSRLGSSFYSLGRFQDAVEAYEKGLKYDPSNVQMKEALEDAKERLAGPSAPGGIPNLFQGPDTFVKLQNDPRTRAFMNDPSFVQIINNIQKNPKSLQ